MNSYKRIHIFLLIISSLLLVIVVLLKVEVVGGTVDDATWWMEIGEGSASGGGISNSSWNSFYSSLAIDLNGMPIVAWRETIEEIPGRSERSAGIKPLVPWEPCSDPSEIHVRQWDGNTWVGIGSSASLGGISDNLGCSDWPSLAIAPDNTPIVAWEDASNENFEIYVRQWNGSTWAEMSNGSATMGGISNTPGESRWPSLAIAPGGTTIIAWEEEYINGNREIYVRQWDDGTWVEMGSGSASGGGISDDPGNSRRPSLAIATNGTPIVAWENFDGSNYDIYVKRWNGSAWEEMGSDSASEGGISNDNGWSYWPSLAITSNGIPIVAWGNDPGSGVEGMDEIFVRRFDVGSNTWVEMGDSASAGGISNTPGESWFVSLDIAPDDTPVVAWQDFSIGEPEIYVRHWNSSDWEEMGSGSASGGGISSNVGVSGSPSLASTADGIPVVAWHDFSNGGDSEIYVRHYQPLCYTLTLSHTGEGNDPMPSPANSPDCPAGSYSADEQITLSAMPASDWQVASWEGTENDISTDTINQLTMPAGEHTVSVNYVRIQDYIFLPMVVYDHSPPP